MLPILIVISATHMTHILLFHCRAFDTFFGAGLVTMAAVGSSQTTSTLKTQLFILIRYLNSSTFTGEHNQHIYESDNVHCLHSLYLNQHVTIAAGSWKCLKFSMEFFGLLFIWKYPYLSTGSRQPSPCLSLEQAGR